VKYRQYELQLNPGDKIFVYTDGVPEATNANHELFGTERMVEALNETKDAGPEGILCGVRHAVDSFVKDAEQFDDLTMLCLEYKGPEASA
jgi:sigma-B regulation protein RsbU (phosphoserine phosphatase)